MHTKVYDTEVTIIAYKTIARYDAELVAVEVRSEQLLEEDDYTELVVTSQESNSRYWRIVCECPEPGRYDFRLRSEAGYYYDDIIYESKLRVLSYGDV